MREAAATAARRAGSTDANAGLRVEQHEIAKVDGQNLGQLPINVQSTISAPTGRSNQRLAGSRREPAAILEFAMEV